MLKKILFVLASVTLCITLTQCTDVRNSGSDDSESIAKTRVSTGKITHGVNRVNLQWVKDQSKVEEIVDNIAGLNIPIVRIGGVKQGGSISQVIDNINTFHSRNIPVLIVIPMWKEMFPDGYEQTKGPSFDVYKMSDIDLNCFESFINEFLSEIALKTAGNSVIGLELFNEINWAGFNGDLQPTQEDKGEIFTAETDLSAPSFADMYKGIGVYGKCLKILRQAIDTHLAGRDVKLVTAGIVADGGWDNYQFARLHGYTLVLPELFFTLLQGAHRDQEDQTNYLSYADAIGVHTYPPLQDDMKGLLEADCFGPISSSITSDMPYWITEWGFSRNKFVNNGGEAERLQYIYRYIDAIEEIGNVEVATFFEFDFTPDHNIWENGKLLESGRFFETVNKN